MSGLTKKAIKESLLRLLEERPLNKITVKELVEDCGINRNTFYYHYQDLPSLLQEIVREDCDRILKEAQDPDSLEECLHVAMEFLLANSRAAKHIYASIDRTILEDSLWKLCEYAVTRYMEKMLRERRVCARDREVVKGFLECECFGLLMRWIREGMETDMTAEFTRLMQLCSGQIEQILDRCEPDDDLGK